MNLCSILYTSRRANQYRAPHFKQDQGRATMINPYYSCSFVRLAVTIKDYLKILKYPSIPAAIQYGFSTNKKI